jgi:hypothetical protein
MQTAQYRYSGTRSGKTPVAIVMSGETGLPTPQGEPTQDDTTDSGNTPPDQKGKKNPFMPQGNGSQDTPIGKP